MTKPPSVNRIGMIVVLAMSLSACDREQSPVGIHPVAALTEVVSQSPPLVDSLQGEPDRTFLGLQTQVPAFGGMFVDSNGTPTIYVTDTSAAAAAIAQVRPLVAALQQSSAQPIRSTVRVLVGRYNWRQLKMWEGLAGAFLTKKGVSYVDADEQHNVVVIGVTDATSQTAVQSALANMAIPASAVSVPIVGALATTSSYTTDVLSPESAGLRIFNNATFDECTLGYMTEPNAPYNYYGFLTASHCNVTPGSPSSDYWTQGNNPYPFAPYISDTTTVDPPYTVTVSPCPPGASCRRSDAMLVAYLNGVAQYWPTTLQIAPTDSLIINNPGYFVAATDWSAAHNMVGVSVTKEGSVGGGWTCPITATGLAVQEPSGRIILNTSYAHCTTTQAVVKPGDSGSPVFVIETPGGTNVEAEGVLFGAPYIANTTTIDTTTFAFSTINEVMKDFGNRPKIAYTDH